MAERGEWPGGGLFLGALSLSRSKNTPPLLVFQPPPVQQNSPRFKLLPLSVSKKFPTPFFLLCWVRFIEQVGVAFVDAHGSGSRGGWSAIGCYCRGSAPTAWSAAGRGTVSKRHCSNSFLLLL